MSFARAEDVLTGPRIRNVVYPPNKQRSQRAAADFLRSHREVQAGLSQMLQGITTLSSLTPAWNSVLLWTPTVTDRGSMFVSADAVEQVEQSVSASDELDAVPAWTFEALSALLQQQSLQVNWDSYGGVPVASTHAETAWRFLAEVMTDALPLPDFIPLADGGLQLEWDDGTTQVSFTTDEDDDPTVWITSPSESREVPSDEVRQLFEQYVANLRTLA